MGEELEGGGTEDPILGRKLEIVLKVTRGVTLALEQVLGEAACREGGLAAVLVFLDGLDVTGIKSRILGVLSDGNALQAFASHEIILDAELDERIKREVLPGFTLSSGKSLLLLKYLLTKSGVVSFEDLALILGQRSKSTTNQMVNRLRAILVEHNSPFEIVTVTGHGYLIRRKA